MTTAAKFTGRREDFRLVTGQGHYTADWSFPDQVYGQFLRSNYAHAEIVSNNVEEAQKSPGVICILTGKDTAEAGLKNPLPMTHMKGKGGAALKHPPRPPLAVGRVRFVGEPIALVVAESEAQALDAIEKIAIEYRELPPVMDYEAALKPGTQVIHGEAEGNLAMEYELGNAEATHAAFAKAAHVVKVTLDAQRISGNPMEPKAPRLASTMSTCRPRACRMCVTASPSPPASRRNTSRFTRTMSAAHSACAMRPIPNTLR